MLTRRAEGIMLELTPDAVLLELIRKKERK
jgi:hypothetical protein